ncbi:MAG: peptidoglycan-binding protein [Cyanobacteria bacterium SID2]|nr:peptidoglycan-binding protein [Cyanobacteria bacterium SID2]MBP0005128.1 peptidoglycan-binding protein [Cyanobacteria bacterium SBC]
MEPFAETSSIDLDRAKIRPTCIGSIVTVVSVLAFGPLASAQPICDRTTYDPYYYDPYYYDPYDNDPYRYSNPNNVGAPPFYDVYVDEVVAVQSRLRELGYLPRNYRLTGTYDRPTENALQQFQFDRGLVVDGIVGLQTRAALFGYRY